MHCVAAVDGSGPCPFFVAKKRPRGERAGAGREEAKAIRRTKLKDMEEFQVLKNLNKKIRRIEKE